MLARSERQTVPAAKIVNGLLNLPRPPCSRPVVDVHAVVNDVLSLLEHQLKQGCIQMLKELAATPPIVLGIGVQAAEVFLNLFLNASDAMPKGGWLSIATNATPDGATIEVWLARVADGCPCRPVLDDEGHRQGHRPRAVDHLRNRAGTRRHDYVRETQSGRARSR